MKKKIIITSIIVLLVFCGCSFKQKKYFISFRDKLDDDLNYALMVPGNETKNLFFDFKLTDSYAATLTATYNDEVLSTENLGTFKGIGKYYLTIANDGKRLKYYDYLISNGFSSSAFDWQDIPFETEGLGSIDSTGFSNIIKPSGDKIELGKIFISRSREKADEVVTISLDLIKELSK